MLASCKSGPSTVSGTTAKPRIWIASALKETGFSEESRRRNPTPHSDTLFLLGESFDAPDEIEFRLWVGVPVAKATLRRLCRPSFFQGGASFREPMDFQCHLDAHEYTKTISNYYASPCPRESEPLKYSFAIREMFDKHYS